MMWMINVFCSVLALVVTLGPVRHLGLPRWAVWVVGVALVVLAQQALAHRLFGASILSPDAMPVAVVAVLVWGMGFLLAAGGLTLAWGVLRLCHVSLSGWWPLALGAAAATWLVWQGERVPPVREHVVEVPGLPEAADGLRVAVLADLHVDHWRGRTWCAAVVERVNAARPALVFFTGDQADGPFAEREADLEPLRGLVAPLGKYLVSGNHEHYFEAGWYLHHYERLGITVLDGRVVSVAGLGLIGLPDRPSLTGLGEEADLLRRLVGQVRAGDFPVLLAHKPAIAHVADALGVGLQFSGHTHGGQVPGVATVVRRTNAGLVRGWYTLPKGLRLFVSPGAGVWIGFPFRFYRSEIALVTLRRGA